MKQLLTGIFILTNLNDYHEIQNEIIVSLTYEMN